MPQQRSTVIIKRANYDFGNFTSTIGSKLKKNFDFDEFLKGCLNSGFDLDTCRLYRSHPREE